MHRFIVDAGTLRLEVAEFGVYVLVADVTVPSSSSLAMNHNTTALVTATNPSASASMRCPLVAVAAMSPGDYFTFTKTGSTGTVNYFSVFGIW